MGRDVIVLDARMARSSGIGVYIRNLFPLVIAALHEYRFLILARPGEGESIAARAPERARIAIATSAVYTAREQLELARLIPSDTAAFWSPHYVVPALYRGRLMATVHDMAHLALPQFYGQFHRHLYARAMFRILKWRADHVFCVSRFTAAELGRLTGFPGSRCSVVHLGISPSWLARDVARTDTRAEPPYFLYVGNIKPHKNVVRLLDAFSALIPRIPHQLVIVGRREGFLTGEPRAVARAAPLGARVRFAGEVDDDELRSLYTNATALVMPSLYEGFGLPPLEAMACGAPVIVSNRASLPEVCGDAAEYCDPDSTDSIAAAMERVACSPERRAVLRSRGLERARSFRWEPAAEAVAKTFRSIIGGEQTWPPRFPPPARHEDVDQLSPKPTSIPFASPDGIPL